MKEKKYLVIAHLKDGDVSITPKGKSYCTYAEAQGILTDFTKDFPEVEFDMYEVEPEH